MPDPVNANTTVPCLPNLRSHTVENLQFWEHEWTFPTNLPKEEFKRWAQDESTQHCCYSVLSGQNPSLRVSSDNPPRMVHGLVLDYDADFGDDEISRFVQQSLNTDYPVNFIGRSYRGGVHALWLFSEPVLVTGAKSAEALLRTVSGKVKAVRLARGLDERSTSYYQYFTVGGSWQRVSHNFIPQGIAAVWASESTRREDLRAYNEVVPIELVREEVQRRFPNRWSGFFDIGERGVRFWDAEASNDSAAIIREGGMQCFTGVKPFVTWREIFGDRFVDRVLGDQLGPVLTDWYYDGKKFWSNVTGSWRDAQRQDLVLQLRSLYGLSAKVPKGQNESQLETAIAQITTANRVDIAAPLPFDDRRVVDCGGVRLLNTSTLKPMIMSEAPETVWGGRFPVLGRWLSGLFGEEQLPYFLSWLHLFYRGAVDRDLSFGQALFIAGDPSCGKTYLNKQVLSKMVGGSSQPAQYLQSISRFNSQLFQHALWTLDDEAAATDQQKFSMKVKEFIANNSFTFEGKGRDAFQVPWAGRIVATLNSDAHSLKIIPDLDVNISDKLMLFHVKAAEGFTFSSENKEAIARELPFFCRFIYDYPIPLHIPRCDRFGIASYINPELNKLLLATSDDTYVIEMIDIVLNNTAIPDTDVGLELTVSEFLTRISKQSLALTRSLSQRGLQRSLERLERRGHPRLQRVATGTDGTRWLLKKNV